MLNTRTNTHKWNAAIINVVDSTCAFPTMSIKNAIYQDSQSW